MSKYTKIEWTHGTVNPTSGCDGCEILRECYARQVHENRLAHSFPRNYAANFLELRTIPGRMAEAAKWGPLTDAEVADKPWFGSAEKKRRRHIFISDMSDALSAAVPFEYLKAEIIDHVSSENGRRHVWQWLTKRPERMAEFCAWLEDQGIEWPANLWAGTSITTQPTADKRIPHVLKVNAARIFLSVEPMRGRIDVARWLGTYGINWVICGGESGALTSHPIHPDWARALRDQCGAAGVPFFFKQWGGRNKKATGRQFDGREWNEIPQPA